MSSSALVALAAIAQLFSTGAIEIESEDERWARLASRPMQIIQLPGPKCRKGGWDVAVDRREKKLSERKRERQARRKQRRKS